MGYWGRVLGTLFGYMFMRFPGAVLGYVVGHFFDLAYAKDLNKSSGWAAFFSSSPPVQQQTVFFHSLFSTLGHLAKADGRVTAHEIQIATQLMDQMGLRDGARQRAQQAFREGKDADFPVHEVLQTFCESCHNRRDIRQMFLEILIQAALADGRLSSDEYAVLEKVAAGLGFKRRELEFLVAAYEAEVRFRTGQQHKQRASGYGEKQAIEDAYRILGVDAGADETTLKRAYRKKMTEHHPDKLMSKGLPQEAMDIAKAKAQSIQAAYERIKAYRANQR